MKQIRVALMVALFADGWMAGSGLLTAGLLTARTQTAGGLRSRLLSCPLILEKSGLTGCWKSRESAPARSESRLIEGDLRALRQEVASPVPTGRRR